jgi:hypothetical protein
LAFYNIIFTEGVDVFAGISSALAVVIVLTVVAGAR